MDSKKIGTIIAGIAAIVILILLFRGCSSCLNNCNCGGDEDSSCEHEYGEWLIEEAPTLTEWGYVYQMCSKCGGANKISLDPFNSYSGHYTKRIVKEPTCTETGIAEYTFSNLTFTVELAKLSHTFNYTAENDDTTKDKFICECGETYFSEHSYIKGACSYCNAVMPVTVTYVEKDGSTQTINQLYGDSFINQERESTTQSYFHGWFDEKGNLYDGGFILEKDLTVYAKWESVVLVSSYQDFLKIYDAPDKVYRLTQNIDMAGNLLQPIPQFNGIIDGLNEENGSNFTIENFLLTTDSTVSNFGLFAVNNGMVKNIDFKSCLFSGSIGWNSGGALGGIVGVNNGKIYNVNINNAEFNFNLTKREKTNNTYTLSIGVLTAKNNKDIQKVTVNSSLNLHVSCGFDTGLGDLSYNQKHYFYVGAVAGYNSGNIAEGNSDLTADFTMELYHGPGDSMTGYAYYGSFVGYNGAKGSISRSYSVANLNIKTPTVYNSNWSIASSHVEHTHERSRIGGFVGVNGDEAEISECFASGIIGGYAGTSNYVGGFVGSNEGTADVKSCYCSTSVSTTASAGGVSMGGFAGVNNAVIQNSYSTGSVSSPNTATVGGFIGTNEQGASITKTYTTSNTTATSGTAGIFTGVNKGIISKSYYTNDIIFKKGSTSQGTLSVTTDLTEIAFNELITKSFLTQNLYWDEEGWYIGSDNNPFLTWEFEKLHNYGEPTVILPNCETAGFTVYECVDCGLIFITDVIEPLGHNYIFEYEKESWIAPTHTQAGKEYYGCDHGGAYNTSQHIHEVTVAPLPHDDTSNISCENLSYDGSIYTYLCSCGEIIEVNPADIVHVEEFVSPVTPTCGTYNELTGKWENPQQGNMDGAICSVCKVILRGCEVLEPHSFTSENTIVLQKVSCTQIGIIQKTCSICSFVHEEEEPMLEHSYKSNPLKCDTCDQDRFTVDATFRAINSSDDLKTITPGGHYYLNCNIELANQVFTPLLSANNPFVGIFLSNGYKIKNLNLTAENQGEFIGGLFASVGLNGYVIGLTIENLTVTATNVNALNIGGIAGINNGTISNCSITGAIIVNLTASATRSSVGVASTSFDYNFGGIVANNGDNGLVSNCSVSANINAKYVIDTNLAPINVSQYFKDLINNTSLTNNVELSLGAIAGVNSGNIKECSSSATFTSSLNLSNKVSGLNRGKAFTYLALNEGGLCGINSGSISNCVAKADSSFLHTKDDARIYQNNEIKVLNVVLKQECYQITDNAVFENNYVGVIGKTTNSSKITDLTVN